MARDPLGMRPVVGVLHGDEIAARLGQRPVARAVASGVLRLPDQPEARIGAREIGGHVRARVVRRVVDHEDLEVRMGLLREAPQGRPEGRLRVVDGHDDRDQRPGGGSGPGRAAQVVEREGGRGVAQGDPGQSGAREDRVDRREPRGVVVEGVRAQERRRDVEAADPRVDQGPRLGAPSGPVEQLRLDQRLPAIAGEGGAPVAGHAGEIEGGLRSRPRRRATGRGRARRRPRPGAGSRDRPAAPRARPAPGGRTRPRAAPRAPRRRPSCRAAAEAARAPSPRTRPGRGRAGAVAGGNRRP